MSGRSEIVAIAAEEIPYGSPVRAEGRKCAVAPDLRKMIGIARRAPGDRHSYAKGEPVAILTEGGIAARLSCDADIVVRDVPVRLMARDPLYLELREARIVGFLGDWRLDR